MIRGKISNRGNIVSGYLADFNDINENIYNYFLKYVKDCNDNMLDFDFWKTFYYFCALNPDGGETFIEDYCLYPEIIKEIDEFVKLKYSFLNNDNGQPDIITFSTKEDNSYQIFEYNNFFYYYDFFFKDKKLIHFRSDDSSFSLFSKNSKYIYRKYNDYSYAYAIKNFDGLTIILTYNEKLYFKYMIEIIDSENCESIHIKYDERKNPLDIESNLKGKIKMMNKNDLIELILQYIFIFREMKTIKLDNKDYHKFLAIEMTKRYREIKKYF